jgi:hypothetical protein
MKLTPTHAKIDKDFAEPEPHRPMAITPFKMPEVRIPAECAQELPKNEETLVRSYIRAYAAVDS